MPITSILTCLGIGAIAGAIAAMFGVGGGVIMVPCFVFMLRLDQKNAVATSLMAMIGAAVVASLQNQKNGLGDWKLALVTTCGAMITAYLASDWLRKLSNETLTKSFGLFLVVMGARMLWMGKA